MFGHISIFTFNKLAQKVFSCFLGSEEMVSLEKHLARKLAVSALILGFLFSRAANTSSVMGSRVVCLKCEKKYDNFQQL